MATESDSTNCESSQSQSHTPGPWVARPYPESKVGRITVTGKHSPVPIAEVIPTTLKGYDAVAEANGRLIAPAPEMLSALQWMVKWAQRYGLTEAPVITGGNAVVPVIQIARKAIARATGAES